VSFDSINFIVKDTHDRVKSPNNGEYYPIDRVHATRVLNANNNYLYDKNGRLVNKNTNDTLIIEGGLTKNETPLLFCSGVFLMDNAILHRHFIQFSNCYRREICQKLLKEWKFPIIWLTKHWHDITMVV
jgi:hypothetical protein